MKVAVFTELKKRLNLICNMSICVSGGSWIFIFPMIKFDLFPSILVMLIIASFVAAAIGIGTRIVAMFSKVHISLHPNHQYELALKVRIGDTFAKPKILQSLGHSLRDLDTSTVVELEKKEARKLQYCGNAINVVYVDCEVQTNSLYAPPSELAHGFANLFW